MASDRKQDILKHIRAMAKGLKGEVVAGGGGGGEDCRCPQSLRDGGEGGDACCGRGGKWEGVGG